VDCCAYLYRLRPLGPYEYLPEDVLNVPGAVSGIAAITLAVYWLGRNDIRRLTGRSKLWMLKSGNRSKQKGGGINDPEGRTRGGSQRKVQRSRSLS